VVLPAAVLLVAQRQIQAAAGEVGVVMLAHVSQQYRSVLQKL
jgi:hypothetical protein